MSFIPTKRSSVLDSDREGKRTKLTGRLSLKKDFDLGALAEDEVMQVSADVQYKTYRWAVCHASFHKLQPGFADLQLRFAELNRHRLSEDEQWIAEWENTVAKRKKMRPRPELLGNLARTMGDIREAASAVSNWPAAALAAHIETSAVCCLITVDAMHGGILDYHMSDAKERLDITVPFLEEQDRRKRTILTVDSKASSTISAMQAVETVAPSRQVANAPVSQTNDIPLDQHLQDRVKNCHVDLELGRTVPWAKVYGVDELKDNLENDMFIFRPDVPKKYRSSSPLGTLIYGPGGTGKTTLVLAFAKMYNLPLYRVTGSVKGSFPGETERTLSILFEQLVAVQPSILFFPHADGLFRNRETSDTSTVSYLATIKMLWTRMITRGDKVFVFATTNNPWDMSNAGFNTLFTRRQFVGLPDEKARRQLLGSAFASFEKISEQDIMAVARISSGYTGDDFERAAGMLYIDAVGHVRQARSWETVIKDGNRILYPRQYVAGEQEISFHDLDEAQRRDVRVRPIESAELKSYFNVDSQERLGKTVTDAELKEFVEWENRCRR